ncbi:hypothetical protein [Ensifer aridi]|uniref:hypothetical protein n=1 Tax=Ensifer aridi TaxID=1708715 RepID=UPI00358EB614
MDTLGGAVDNLVRDLYSNATGGLSIVQEPEITARLCQRLEDRLDGQRVGNYVFRVTAQTMADRGPRSLEKITGADLLLSVSLDGPNGFDKALFVQAKYDRNVKREELLEACQRMERHVGTKGAYIWIYEQDGVKVISPHQVRRMRGNTFEGLQRRSMAGLTGRILDCYAGSREWGIPMGANRRQVVEDRLRQVRAQNALDIAMKRA